VLIHVRLVLPIALLARTLLLALLVKQAIGKLRAMRVFKVKHCFAALLMELIHLYAQLAY